MKIFITGDPHCGKTTMLNNLIGPVKDKQGFVTKEIPDGQGGRLGFELIDTSGNTATLAHIDNPSKIRVSKYGVDIPVLEKFIEPLFEIKPNQLLYIDEVGAMELFSAKFRQLVDSYLHSPNPFIGTVSNTVSDPLVTSIIKNPNWELFDIRPEIRDLLFSQLQGDIERATS